MPKIVDLIGKKFGRLTVTGRTSRQSKTGKRQAKWTCKCECGEVTEVCGYSLKNGDSTSCGCRRKEVSKALGAATRIHGHAIHGKTSREYATWRRMLRDCYNKNSPNYNRYGGRGITVCTEWRVSFTAFLRDMGERPHGKTIDRKDGSLGYFKENCQWATPIEQQRNRENAIVLTIRGETKTLNEWAESTGRSRQTIYARLRAGRTPESAVFTPSEKGTKAYANN